jgi:broad specificity phosphatase PhoE
MKHANQQKHVYFARHGESVGNVANTFQGHAGGLSPKGIEQARALAERFMRIPIDIILASTMERARQTAEIINENLQKPIIFSKLLIEVRRPSEMWGKPQDTEAARKMYKLLALEDHEPTWRYSDEENFSDRIERACRAIAMFQERPETVIAVVSHGTFIRTVLACMALGASITPAEYAQFVPFFHKANTGISLCDYGEDTYGNVRWKLRHWNDIAHLSAR